MNLLLYSLLSSPRPLPLRLACPWHRRFRNLFTDRYALPRLAPVGSCITQLQQYLPASGLQGPAGRRGGASDRVVRSTEGLQRHAMMHAGLALAGAVAWHTARTQRWMRQKTPSECPRYAGHGSLSGHKKQI
eukprot:765023-Hanusia_phi.AAC.1